MFAPVVPEAEAVKVTPQLAVEVVPALSAQLVALNIPDRPFSVNVTVPLGVVAPTVEVSVTVAVQVEG